MGLTYCGKCLGDAALKATVSLLIILSLLIAPILQPQQCLAVPSVPSPAAPNSDGSEPPAALSPSAPMLSAPVAGAHNVLTILVDFPDCAGTQTPAHYNGFLFGASESLKEYYEEASYGKFTVNGTVVGSGWYRSIHDMAWWGEDKAVNTLHDDQNGHIYDLAKEAIIDASADVNFKRYDLNGDNKIQSSELSIWIIHAGNGQEASGVANDIWSHRWSIPGGVLIGGVGGVTIWNYTMEAENSPMGTFAHEFGHDLNLPDLYDLDRGSSDRFVARWDVMATGSWNGVPQGSSPAHFTSWSKISMGWLNASRVTVVSSASVINVTINALELPSANVTKIVTGSTYYLVEVRQQTLYDSALPDYGVLILYCDDSIESGRGIVKVINSQSSDSSLDEAPFNVGAGENSTFVDAARGVTVTVLSALGTSFRVQVNYHASNVRISAAPLSLTFNVDGVNFTAPTVFTWASGSIHTITVPDLQGSGGVRYLFGNWSDGGGRTHTITVGSSDTAVTANYRTQYLLTVTSSFGVTSGSGWYNDGAVAHASLDVGTIGGVNGSRLRFANWSGGASGTSFSESDSITMNGAKSVTANWKKQYTVALTFKAWDGATALNPSQGRITSASPSNTLTITDFSSVWLDDTQWSLSQIIWRGSDVAPTASYTPMAFGRWNITCKVYRVDFTNAFRDSKGNALTVQASSLSLLCPNGSNTEAIPVGSYLLQRGSFELRYILWRDFEVKAASSVGFDSAAGNPQINCAISDLSLIVKDAFGLAVSGINVNLVSASSGAVVGSSTTDSSGKVAFQQLPDGDYRAEIASLSPVSATLNLSGDRTVQATAFMSYPMLAVVIAMVAAVVLVVVAKRRR